MKKILILLVISLFNISFAQLTLDRTRVIFDRAKSNSQSIVISNTNQNEPYLAQSWIEDANGKKIDGPLVALPILQRINPGQEKQVKISLVGQKNLPEDRESMLFFNVLGVPPKTGGENQINVVIQSKVKLFYRPKGLKQYADNGWLKEVKVTKSGNGYTLQNPTPYHLVVFGVSSSQKGHITEKNLVIPPFEKMTINQSLGNTPTFHFINDFGGTESQSYRCSNNDCQLVE